MKHFFYAVALLCFGAAEGSAQYFNNFDSWPIIAGEGSWSQNGPGGLWQGNGTYVNFGNERSGLRKVGFNDVGDRLEMPPVTNLESVSFYARLSSGPRARLALEYNKGSGWRTYTSISVISTTYQRYRVSPNVEGSNIRLRLRMNAFGNSIFLDDLEVTTFVLPVELAEFTAEAKADGAVHLYWRTLTETGNERFEVQRSREGSTFETIGLVAGAGTTTVPQRYTFRDSAPIPGVSYYRLRQIDFDGTVNFSPIRSVRTEEPGGSLRITSGILTGELQIDLSPAPSERLLLLFDRHGKIVRQEAIPRQAASMTVRIGELPPGLYFLKVEGEVVRFVKM